jgi:hypothetical protein
MRNQIARVKQEILELNATTAAETAAEAWKNSWTAWLLSFVYEQRKDTLEEKERSDRDRRGRIVKKALMDAQVHSYEVALWNEQALFQRAKYAADAAIMVDKAAIHVIKNRVEDRGDHEREAKRNRKARGCRGFMLPSGEYIKGSQHNYTGFL